MSSLLEQDYQTETGDGAAMLTAAERYMTPKSIKIGAFENRLADERSGRRDAHQARMDEIRVDIADAGINLAAAKRVEKRNLKIEERYQKQIDDGKAALKREADEFEAGEAKRSQSAQSYTRPFFDSVNRRHADCNTPLELAAGEGERAKLAGYRGQKNAKVDEKRQVIKASRIAAEIRQSNAVQVNRVGRNTTARIRMVRGVGYAESTGRLSPNSFDLLSVNPVELLCAIDPDRVTESLNAIALEGHNEQAALSMDERRAKIAAIDAEILLIERKSEALVRHCFENGIEPGPRITSNPLAILDIEPA